MSSRWWYGLAIGAPIWLLAFLLPNDWLGDTTVGGIPVGAAFGVVLLASWIWMPVALYLDWRAIADDVAWDPGIGGWLLATSVWIGNVSAATAYVIRRDCALRGTVPSDQWRRGVVAGLGLWGIVVVADVAADSIALGPVEPVIFGPILGAALMGYPVALYLDLAHVRGYTDWDPNARVWILASVIPLVNLVAGAGYLVRRQRAFAETDDPSSLSLDAVAGGDGTDSRPSSRWYRWAVAIFAVHFLLVVGVAASTSLSETGIELLAVVLWLPFGLVFAAMVYLDQRHLRDRGVDWGPTRHLYLVSVIAQAVAFWYLLRRHLLVQRARPGVGATSGSATGDVADATAGAAADHAGDGPTDDPQADHEATENDEWGADSRPWGADGRDGRRDDADAR